ncbi:hypothetical protein [Hymenobacter psoromatis]|uniref:hypothetical protein n=1 Tax=Hymenobacter psoromatis TaxID=1484116 RepID=UPI001CBC666C|nr:hypothetical protein [Hymenobacter psoromatis]
MCYVFGELNTTIQAVISSYEVLGELMSKFRILFHSYPPHEGRSWAAHEAEGLALLANAPNLVVLARALRLVLDEQVFVHRNRTIIFD